LRFQTHRAAKSGKEIGLTSKHLWRAALVVVLSVALCTPARGDSLQKAADGVIALAIVGAAAIVIGVVVVVHYSTKPRTITGCVSSANNAMALTDEKDKQVYSLAGDTAGVKPGERMTLRGKKLTAPNANHTLTWETKKPVKDLGVCQP